MPNRFQLTSLEDRSVPASLFDFNYGTDGLASLPGLTAAAIDLLPDGSAYVAGAYRLSGDDNDFGVFKLTPAGRPDPTFGSNGLVTIPFDLAGPTTGDDIPTTVDVLPDGRVMVVGTAAGANFSQVAAARLLPSGMLDPSFDADGKLAFALDPTATAFETLLAAGIRPDGSLVATGRSGRAAVAVRLNPDGGRDTDYGQVALGADAAAAAVDTDGRVLVAHLAGTLVSPVELRNDLSVSRVDASGRLDATYGGDGRAEAGSLTFQPDRRSFAVAGVAALTGGRALASVTRVSTLGNPDREAVVTRLDAAGSPDPGFASTTELDLSRVREDAAGRLIGGPYVEPSGPVVLRRTPDGQPDPGFGRGGLVDLSLIGVTSADRVPRAPLPDGTVIVAAVVGGEGYKVVRVLPTANESPTLSGAPLGVTTQAAKPISFSFVVADPDQAADSLVVTATAGDPALLPAAGVTVSGTGAVRSVTLTPAPGRSGDAVVTLTVRDRFGATATSSVAVSVIPFLPVLGGTTRFAAGPGAGGGPTVGVFNTDGSPVRTLSVLSAGFTGGVRVAEADLTGDGVADLVVGTGPGSATRVEVYDGVTFAHVFATDPFEPSFTGGVFVAAGDLTGDGRADLVATPDEGGGPRVKVYDGASFALLADFFGIEDVTFRGGARAAVGDLDGDRVGDLIVAAGFGGGPRVAGFNGRSLGGNPARVIADLFVFEQTLRNGVYVTAGDVDGDTFADLIVGGGPGGGPRVLALDGRQLVAGRAVPLADFFAGDQADRTGVRVTAKDVDGDSLADVVTGVGQRAAAYLGKSLAAGAAPAFAFDPLADSPNGVFVG